MYESKNKYPFYLPTPPDYFSITSAFDMRQPKDGVRGTGTTNDSDNGYRGGDIVYGTNNWDFGESRVSSNPVRVMQTAISITSQTAINLSLDRADSDGKIAILAVPHRWVNTNLSNKHSNKKVFDIICKGIDASTSLNYNAYKYYIVCRTTSGTPINVSPITVTGQITKDNKILKNVISKRTVTYYEDDVFFETTSPPAYYTDVNYKITQIHVDGSGSNNLYDSRLWLLSIQQAALATYTSDNRILVTGDSLGSYADHINKDTSLLMPFDDGTMQAYTLLCTYDEFKGDNKSKYRIYELPQINRDGFAFPEYINRNIANWIDSALPIFTCDNNGVQNLIHYLTDKKYVSANDLTVSDIDLRTDWTIYVKGKNRPDIFVTEHSPGLEEYLKSSKNTLGLTAQDFTIQYRAPYYTVDSYSMHGAVKNEWTLTDVYVPLLPYQKYDYVLQTNWTSLCTINYQNFMDLAFNGDFSASEGKYLDYPFYAQLQFRLYYNDKIYSSWCDFGIGEIGSPSVPDFSKQYNWGQCLSPIDGSSVKIIYDEYPDGYQPDDYQKPDNDSDKDIIDPNGDTGNGTLPGADTTLGLNRLTQSYRLTDDNLDMLGNFMWTADAFDNIKLLNNSPLENIVSVKIMPCSVSGTTSEIVLGNVNTHINADKINNVPIVDVGTLTWRGYYDSFLDFAPFTQAYIFLPFIGFYELDPAQCVNKSLNVKYSFDVILGQCKAMIFIDNVYYTSYEGACGIDVPLVGTNRGQLEASLLASTVSASTSGNLLSGAANIASQLITSQFHSTRSGAYSPTLGWIETRRCFVIFMIPNSQYPRTYGHDYGYPCNLSYNLGQLSGFTQTIPNPDISGIACTNEEGEMIKQLLASGVYL